MATISEQLEQAIALHRAGKLNEAEMLYREILQQSNDSADANHLLGLTLYQKGIYRRAVCFISRAVELDNSNAVYYSNLALVFADSGDVARALQAYQNSLAIVRTPEVLNAYGVLCSQADSGGDAEEALLEALQLKPDYVEASYNLGNLYSDSGRLEEAVIRYKQALSERSDYVKGWNNLGNAYRELGMFDLAQGAFEKTIELNADFREAYINLANVKQDCGEFDDAIALYDRAIEMAPDSADAFIYKGNTLKDAGRLEESICVYRLAIELEHDNPDAHLFLGMALLMLGEFSEGWREFSWRLERPDMAHLKLSLPLWSSTDGASGGERVLVLAEQGFGDTIQFARYIPLLKERCCEVTFVCRNAIRPLFETLAGIDKFIDVTDFDGCNVSSFDSYIPIMSLAGCFDGIIPETVPYLSTNRALSAKWEQEFFAQDGDLKVGLCWAGSRTNTNDRNRSSNWDFFRIFTNISGVSCYNLQKDAGNLECDLIGDYSSGFESFADTAAFMEGLDLVISVDTSIAHLAGALGKRVWLLLPFSPEWRWFRECSESLWYPSMRIFRQRQIMDWGELVVRVSGELSKLLLDRENEGKI